VPSVLPEQAIAKATLQTLAEARFQEWSPVAKRLERLDPAAVRLRAGPQP